MVVVALEQLIPPDVKWHRAPRCQACLRQVTLDTVCVLCGRCEFDCDCHDMPRFWPRQYEMMMEEADGAVETR